MPPSGFTLGERVHWWRVIADLERAGVSQAKIAATLRRSVGWVDYVKNSPGADPKTFEGDALRRLWALHTGCPLDEVPSTAATLSASRVASRAQQGAVVRKVAEQGIDDEGALPGVDAWGVRRRVLDKDGDNGG